MKTTPLHAEHIRLGAKMIAFGGWDMPVQYTGIVDEHQAVRTTLGVFDISHMGQFFVRGAGSGEWLNGMLTNDTTRLSVGQGQYTLMLNERGGVIDDLIIYRIGETEWLLVVNASKIDEDIAWLSRHKPDGLELIDSSDAYAGIAVQGPQTVGWFKSFAGEACGIPPRNSIAQASVRGVSVFVARTGYTGEDGVELFCAADDAVRLLGEVLTTGAGFGIKPCGLGARDTLRMEMCYPLNGNDLSPDHSPIEAGLGFFVALDKPAFIGREPLVAQKANGPARKLTAFKMVGNTPPPRPHYSVWADQVQVGETCSGGLSPSLKCGIGLAYLPAAIARPGTALEIDIRGKRFPAVIEKKPLWKPKSA